MTPGGLEPTPNALALTSARMAEAADFFLRTPTLKASNFVAHCHTDPIFSVSKALVPFEKVSKFKEAGSILRVGFTLSK